jgi:hypothetical protein
MNIRDFSIIKGPQPIKIYYKGKHTGELVFQMTMFDIKGVKELNPVDFFRIEEAKINGDPEGLLETQQSTLF